MFSSSLNVASRLSTGDMDSSSSLSSSSSSPSGTFTVVDFGSLLSESSSLFTAVTSILYSVPWSTLDISNDVSSVEDRFFMRSEERRVGRECRSQLYQPEYIQIEYR